MKLVRKALKIFMIMYYILLNNGFTETKRGFQIYGDFDRDDMVDILFDESNFKEKTHVNYDTRGTGSL